MKLHLPLKGSAEKMVNHLKKDTDRGTQTYILNLILFFRKQELILILLLDFELANACSRFIGQIYLGNANHVIMMV